MRPTKFETAWNVHFNSKTFSHTFYLTKICPKNGKYFDTKIPSIAATFLLVGEILGNFPGINFAQKKIYFSLVTAGFNCAHKSSVGCHRIRANISWNSNPEKFIFMQICPISHWLLLRQWRRLRPRPKEAPARAMFLETQLQSDNNCNALTFNGNHNDCTQRATAKSMTANR